MTQVQRQGVTESISQQLRRDILRVGPRHFTYFQDHRHQETGLAWVQVILWVFQEYLGLPLEDRLTKQDDEPTTMDNPPPSNPPPTP